MPFLVCPVPDTYWYAISSILVLYMKIWLLGLYSLTPIPSNSSSAIILLFSIED